MNWLKRILTILFFIIIPTQIRSLTIGSDVGVSREIQINFPTNANSILSFASMGNGFIFADVATSCNFSSFFPVGGTVNLKGGSLTLLTDFIFEKNGTMSFMGNIIGNGHILDLSTSQTYLVGDVNAVGIQVYQWSNINTFLNSDISLQSAILFAGNSLLDGGGHCIDLQNEGAIAVGTNSTLTLKNIKIKNLNNLNNRIICAASTSIIKFQDVDLVFSDSLDFSVGKFTVDNDLKLTGSGKFIYSTNQISTINSYSSLILDSNVTFSYAPVSNSRDLLDFTDKTSILELNGGTLHSTTTGLRLTKGTLLVSNNSNLFAEGEVETESISLGNGTEAGNLRVIGAANLEFYGLILNDNVGL
ncbi:MAG: hypothetical protein UR26_C0006G0010 [candidate division TM6 bacterium GW2011_GWF2_32_72]|nr:MAG: hypothetical protein UR26_C0006G0010 [candidate division TM6 bacterium GW2011_GWF2_32_72]